MVAAATADSQTDAAEFRTVYVDARCILSADGLDAVVCDRCNHRVFQSRNEIADAQIRSLQVEQRIHDQLTGSVKSYLATTVYRNHRDIRRCQEMFAVRIDAEGVDGRVLQEPDLIGGLRPPLVGEGGHFAKCRRVVDQPESSNCD